MKIENENQLVQHVPLTLNRVCVHNIGPRGNDHRKCRNSIKELEAALEDQKRKFAQEAKALFVEITSVKLQNEKLKKLCEMLMRDNQGLKKKTDENPDNQMAEKRLQENIE